MGCGHSLGLILYCQSKTMPVLYRAHIPQYPFNSFSQTYCYEVQNHAVASF